MTLINTKEGETTFCLAKVSGIPIIGERCLCWEMACCPTGCFELRGDETYNPQVAEQKQPDHTSDELI